MPLTVSHVSSPLWLALEKSLRNSHVHSGYPIQIINLFSILHLYFGSMPPKMTEFEF